MCLGNPFRYRCDTLNAQLVIRAYLAECRNAYHAAVSVSCKNTAAASNSHQESACLLVLLPFVCSCDRRHIPRNTFPLSAAACLKVSNSCAFVGRCTLQKPAPTRPHTHPPGPRKARGCRDEHLRNSLNHPSTKLPTRAQTRIHDTLGKWSAVTPSRRMR